MAMLHIRMVIDEFRVEFGRFFFGEALVGFSLLEERGARREEQCYVGFLFLLSVP